MSVKDKQTYLELVHSPGHEAKHSPLNAASAYRTPRTFYPFVLFQTERRAKDSAQLRVTAPSPPSEKVSRRGHYHLILLWPTDMFRAFVSVRRWSEHRSCEVTSRRIHVLSLRYTRSCRAGMKR
jgi:hypothetical protein